MHNVTTTEGQRLRAKRQSEFVVVARRLSQNSSAVIGFVVAAFLVVIAVFAPLIAPYPFAKQDLSQTRAAPTMAPGFSTAGPLRRSHRMGSPPDPTQRPARGGQHQDRNWLQD